MSSNLRRFWENNRRVNNSLLKTKYGNQIDIINDDILQINENNFNCKFINASSCDIFGNSNRKLDLSSQKIPVSPYGRSKLASYKLTKKFRENKMYSFAGVF